MITSIHLSVAVANMRHYLLQRNNKSTIDWRMEHVLHISQFNDG